MEILGSRVILRPVDYERTLAFYRDALGLAIAREYPGGTVFFAGQSLLEVAGHGRKDDDPAGFAGAIWLQVRDCENAAAELALKGVRIVRGPKQEPWGLIELWVHDPDGTPIVLVQVPADHPLRRDTRTL
ncbi:VOC family protein [Nocardia huaxiensis]|uniref:VOC family protein n=1 Tax=Nocardia huaxiensis TaxID=2755382 RepID=A0A7D6ZCQ6_9NOCA|nr:VOC family protein [Nocardia huaxiensis]QLY32308.1 VOC family protein [Nocardia huaxiensis]UFS93987.1 VOC family protein [Nocardia huaxiensis]